jgi:protoporphyrinogen oxidase
MDGGSIVYAPYYFHPSSQRSAFTDEQALTAEVVRGLNRLNPSFDESWIEECCISRATHAQAICTVGFSELVPPTRTPLGGLFITDSTQFYPEDRTVSAAIRLGRRTAALSRGYSKEIT